MNDMAWIIAAVGAGLFGSTHCLGMCGGLSGLFAVNTAARSTRSRLPLALAYNLGRIASYAIVGAAAALLGSGFTDHLPGLALPLRILAGSMIILVGLQIALGRNLLRPFERVGHFVWQAISPLAQRLLPVASVPSALGLGLLWGLIPCGLVYGVLLMAVASGTVLQGMATMVAFGVATMPAMLLTGLSAVRVSTLLGQKRLRLGVACLLLIAGGLTAGTPFLYTDHAAHEPSRAAHIH